MLHLTLIYKLALQIKLVILQKARNESSRVELIEGRDDEFLK